jgi:hypothetical protein
LKEIRDLYPPDRHRSVKRNPAGLAAILVVAGVLALGLFEAFALLLRPEATLLFRPGGLRDLAQLIVGIGIGVLFALAVKSALRAWVFQPRRRRRARRSMRPSHELQPPVPVVAARRPEAVRSRIEVPVRPKAPPAPTPAERASSRPQLEVVVRSRKLPKSYGPDQGSPRRVA